MKPLHHSFLIVLTFVLGGCEQAVDRFKTDFDNLSVYGVPENAIGEKRSDALLASPCPQVELVSDLSSLSDFSSEKRMEDKYLVSRVDLNSAETTCKLASNSAIVDLRLVLKSALGPKAKKKSSDKPFFSYPFFVAVTSPSGKIMAKEIFTASMTFSPNETMHTHRENLRQIIPIHNKDVAHLYKVLVGFQLSPEQLSYNRAHMVPAEKADRIPAGAGMTKTKD